MHDTLLINQQCIILTTRPFLFYLLQRRVGTDSLTTAFPLSASTKGLVQVCIESATQIITILSHLRQHDLLGKLLSLPLTTRTDNLTHLDTFLPFDLDGAFSAAFVLLMAIGIHPKLVPTTPWLSSVYQTLDYMTNKGNLLAGIRKSEIEELRQMVYQGNSGISLNVHASAGVSGFDHNLATGTELGPHDPVDTASLPSLGDPFFDVWNPNDGSGFSGTQLLSLADELGNEDWRDIWLEDCS